MNPNESGSGKFKFAALTLAALGLAPGAAHVLELPVKLGYSPALYTQVNSSLYAMFGSVGAVIQLAAVVSAALLVLRMRHRPSFARVLLGALCLVVSLLLWAATVAPVNSQWASVLETRPAEAVASYAALRSRWEYGHVAAFIAWLAGYLALQWSVCVRPTDTLVKLPPAADPTG